MYFVVLYHPQRTFIMGFLEDDDGDPIIFDNEAEAKEAAFKNMLPAEVFEIGDGA